MAKVPLLEGEEIISSVKLPKEQTTLMLTNDGWLVIPVEHRISNISNLSRLFHVNSIKKIEMGWHPWRNKFHALLINLLCIGSISYACNIYVGTFGYTNLLNKHDTFLTGNILRDIDQISVLGNNAAHNMKSSTSDFMSILEKFVNVVEWHISNPPISIIERED